MPERSNHNLYDIAPLTPLIEAGCTLLTPNFRIARRIRSVWDSSQIAAGRRVWLPPLVAPLESWLLGQWERAVELGLLEPKSIIGEGLVIELWLQIIAEHQDSAGQYSLLRPSAAAELASAARETLVRWQLDAGSPALRQEFLLDDDCATFYAWLSRFEAQLARDEMITAAGAIAELLGVAGRMPRCSLALLGFDDIAPLYRAAVEALAADLKTLDAEREPERRRAHMFPDRHSELLGAARWARRLHRENSDAAIAIILPDMRRDRLPLEHLLRREFGALGEDDGQLPVNFSSGTSLDRTPPVRDALSALGFARPHIGVEQVVALLQSRYLDLPDRRSPLALKFITGLYADGAEQVDAGELRYRATQVALGEAAGLRLGQVLLTLSQNRDLREKHRPSAWVTLFSTVLETWGWPGPGPLDSLEYQQVEAWFALLEDFAACDPVCGPLALNASLALLERCAARQLFQPQTADSPIQVLGMLEGAGLSFDHLWICGMQGNTWPAPARPNPLIPLALQRAHDFPHATAAREWTFAEHLMERYSRSAPEVNASYVQLLDGVPELPSALLESFEWAAVDESEAAFDPRWRSGSQIELEQLVDDRAPPVEAAEAARLRGGSGLLEDQSHCPFRAFARRRLAVEPLAEFCTGLSPAARGSILHDALYALWGSLGDSATLAALESEPLDQLIAEAAEAAVQSIPARLRTGLGRAYLGLESRRLQALLSEWLQVEREREEFSVLAREQDITLNLFSLAINLRIDRIDQLADGSALIIDYKSGRCSANDWLGERPSRPQLLLYGTASPQDTGAGPVAALGFAQVRPRDCTFAGAGRVEAAPGIRTDIVKWVGEKHAVSNWEELNRAWAEILARLVTNFIAGDAAVDPLSASSCTYCGLQPLCRVGEHREVSE